MASKKTTCTLEIILPSGIKVPVGSFTPRALERAVYNQRVFATLTDTKTNTSVPLEFRLEPIVRQAVDDFIKNSAAVAATNSNYAPRYPGREATTLLDAYLNRGDCLTRVRLKKLRKLIASGYLDSSLGSLSRNLSALRSTSLNSSHLTQKGQDFISKLLSKPEISIDAIDLKVLFTTNPTVFKNTKTFAHWSALGIISTQPPSKSFNPEMDALTVKSGFYFQEKAYKSLVKNLISVSQAAAASLSSSYSRYRHAEDKEVLEKALSVLPSNQFSVALSGKYGATIAKYLPKSVKKV